MGLIQKEYRYTVGYFERGKWVQVLQTDFEDIDTFELIANAEEFQYRICCDGEEITANYKKHGATAGVNT